MNWRFIEVGKWSAYLSLLLGLSVGISLGGRHLGLNETNESDIFTRLSIVLTIFSGLALWIIRGWAEISIGGGLRPRAIAKLRGEIKTRRIRMYRSLGLGVASGVILQIPAAILDGTTGAASLVLSVIGYICLLNMGACLVSALHDWHQQQELIAGLVEKEESENRRKEELRMLGVHEDDAGSDQE